MNLTHAPPQDDALVEAIADSRGLKARLEGSSLGASSLGPSSSATVEEGVPPAPASASTPVTVADPIVAASPTPVGTTKEGQLYIGDTKAPVMTCQVPVSSAAALRDFVGAFYVA